MYIPLRVILFILQKYFNSYASFSILIDSQQEVRVTSILQLGNLQHQQIKWFAEGHAASLKCSHSWHLGLKYTSRSRFHSFKCMSRENWSHIWINSPLRLFRLLLRTLLSKAVLKMYDKVVSFLHTDQCRLSSTSEQFNVIPSNTLILRC